MIWLLVNSGHTCSPSDRLKDQGCVGRCRLCSSHGSSGSKLPPAPDLRGSSIWTCPSQGLQRKLAMRFWIRSMFHVTLQWLMLALSYLFVLFLGSCGCLSVLFCLVLFDGFLQISHSIKSLLSLSPQRRQRKARFFAESRKNLPARWRSSQHKFDKFVKFVALWMGSFEARSICLEIFLRLWLYTSVACKATSRWGQQE